MNILLILLCIICLCLIWLYAQLCASVRSLHKQLEEIHRGSHIELAVSSRQRCLLALCRSLNQALSAKDKEHILYERGERLLKQNITNLAHDIRTPLTGASGYVQLALESADTEKNEHYLLTAKSRLEELEDMLEKLFLYTKLTSEDYALPLESRKKIQVLPLLGECLLGFYAQFEKTGSAPQVILDAEDFHVSAEEEALRRVFLNLIQNALLHGSGGLRILQEGRDCLTFENPISSEKTIDTARLFDRFYKADPARGKASSGLGLFIVRELMQKMDGNVWAEQNERIFRIVLRFPAPSI